MAPHDGAVGTRSYLVQLSGPEELRRRQLAEKGVIKGILLDYFSQKTVGTTPPPTVADSQILETLTGSRLSRLLPKSSVWGRRLGSGLIFVNPTPFPSSRWLKEKIR